MITPKIPMIGSRLKDGLKHLLAKTPKVNTVSGLMKMAKFVVDGIEKEI